MTIKIWALPIALLLGVSIVATAAAAAVDPAKAYEARHTQFHAIASAYKSIMDGLKAERPDAAAIGSQAKTIEGLAHQIPTWFPVGTGPESGVKTRAKPDIWTDSEGFAAAAKALETQSAALQTIAKTGDVVAIQAQAKALGGACGGCHTKYRGPEIDHDHDHK
ncbi:MAG: hypothetical protein CGW95_14935 [Phenylobacterium zucineum]|nr:MAG: hypothetical protein CGW95_14935 [Phenylobacterium zucineum]